MITTVIMKNYFRKSFLQFLFVEKKRRIILQMVNGFYWPNVIKIIKVTMYF